MKFFKAHSGKFLFLGVILSLSVLGYALYCAPVAGFEDKLIYLLKEYGYIILFAWGIIEGETGLFMAGILCHTGDMNLFWAIFIGGLGGFVGDQIYFYMGRYNKKYIYRNLKKQRRKLAMAHMALQKYGWPIIFMQRYMYGMRTIIPISIGLTRYDAKKFAFINLISAWTWAAITIVPTWYFGQEILKIIVYAKDYWYITVLFGLVIFFWVFYYFHHVSKKTTSISSDIKN